MAQRLLLAGYKYHTFTNDGTLTVTGSGLVECLIVAGGGGGGNKGLVASLAVAGGAGGLIHTALVLSTGAYPIVIGAGGAGAIGTSTAAVNGVGLYWLFGLTAVGGGLAVTVALLVLLAVLVAVVAVGARGADGGLGTAALQGMSGLGSGNSSGTGQLTKAVAAVVVVVLLVCHKGSLTVELFRTDT